MNEKLPVQGKHAPLYSVCKATVLAASAALLGGCSLFSLPNREAEPVAVPRNWSSPVSESSPHAHSWLSDFDDPKLEHLIETAVNRNFNLRAAVARVEAAWAGAKISGADRLPQINAGLQASRSKRNSAGGFRITNPITNRFGLQLDASWQLDLWGRLANQRRAALFDFEASYADLEAARLSLAANIAKTWFSAVEANLQIQLAKSTVDNFESNRDSIEEGFRDGIYSALDVRLARANVAGAMSRLQAQRVAGDVAVRSLEVLLGDYPAGKLQVPKQLPSINNPVPAGLPAELLTRRPDLTAAKRRLAAADQRYVQAKKAFLPSISLTGSGGNSTAEFGDLLDFNFLVWSIAANAIQPIFQGGRLLNQVELDKARGNEALASYAQTVLQAFQEVETALTTETLLTDQEHALQQAADESTEAEILAQEQYLEGLVDIVTLLESQRRAFDSQSTLLQLKNQRLQNRLDLYLALGGPFSIGTSEPDESIAQANIGKTIAD